MGTTHRKRVRHYHEPGDLHELTFSCYHQRPLLTNDVWREMLCRSSEAATLAAINYIHENPVRRGLVRQATDWKWSSARWYAGDATVVDADLPAIHGLPPDFWTSSTDRLQTAVMKSTGGLGRPPVAPGAARHWQTSCQSHPDADSASTPQEANPMARVFRVILAIVAGVAVSFVLVVAVEAFSSVVHPLPADFDGTNEAVCEHVANYPPWVLAVVVPLWGVTALAGTWVAGRLGNRGSALFLAVLLLAAVLFNLSMLPYPLWFKLVQPVVIVGAAWLACHWSRRTRTEAVLPQNAGSDPEQTLAGRLQCHPAGPGRFRYISERGEFSDDQFGRSDRKRA